MKFADRAAQNDVTADLTAILNSAATQSGHKSGSLGPSTGLIPRQVFGDAVRCVDFSVAVVSGALIAWLYVGNTFASGAAGYALAIGLASAVLVVVFQQLNLYSVSKFSALDYQFPRILLGWAVAVAVLASSVFFLKTGSEFSRLWLAVWFGAGVSATLLVRGLISQLTRRWARSGQLSRRAVIFGSGNTTVDVIRAIESDDDADVRICGVFDERSDGRTAQEHAGHRVLGNLQDLIRMARSTRIDLIIIALPMRAEERIAQVVEELSQLPVEIKLQADLSRVRFAPYTYSRVGSIAMLDLLEKPLSAWGGIVKTMFDKVVAILALILLAPVMAGIALAVRLDSRGPIFFKQKRYGLNNELIEVFKFRSMYVDQCDANATRLVTKGDPRVTPVGRFIRKTSLDELPQLFNVLLGELSLVGPRPHAVAAKAGSELYDQVVKCYYKRHKVKPGITGWAQINGWRGETDTHEKIVKRVEHDLYYIENWSIFLDVYILLRTPFALLKSENAY